MYQSILRAKIHLRPHNGSLAINSYRVYCYGCYFTLLEEAMLTKFTRGSKICMIKHTRVLK
jgi:hypothetical protein